MSNDVKLPTALAWKFGHVADCRAGAITAWRHATLPEPDPSEYAGIIAEWETAMSAVAYRAKRAEDYINGLSPEGSFVTSTGDTIDAVIKELRDLRAAVGGTPHADFKAKTDKIDAIKAAHPKPQ